MGRGHCALIYIYIIHLRETFFNPLRVEFAMLILVISTENCEKQLKLTLLGGGRTGTTVYYIDRKNTALKSGRRLRVLTAAVPTV